MEKKVYILCTQFFDRSGTTKKIGGVETYIENLSLLINEQGNKAIVCQFADNNFINEYKNIEIRGYAIRDSIARSRKNRELFKRIKNEIRADDILIFSTDYLIVPNCIKNSIAIQHGIAWDIPKNEAGDVRNILNIFISTLRSCLKYNRYKKVNTIVCVDYNFLNWYRTQVSKIPNKVQVIPNFTEINNSHEVLDDGRIRIIFARRFVKYRGTELFAEAIKILSNKYNNIDVTIAGEGPEKEGMQEILKGLNNIKFCSFQPDESLAIHSQHDIAVVPTIGSEGTSLSLLEAMSAGCACVATNVGGMTNIILDGFNGLLINPNTNELVKGIEKLINNAELRKELALNAVKTVSASFSLIKWKQAWVNLLEESCK